MRKIRVALIGIGNVASTLVQGIKYYTEDESRLGLWHKKVGGYDIQDVEIVEAFDIDQKKLA